jgi:hypothetical protein
VVSTSRTQRPLRGLAVNTAPLSVSSEDGNPWAPAAPWKQATTSAALNTARASEAIANREWSSSTFKISTSVSSANLQWVMGEASDADRERLKHLEVSLDQCWDLLHQRRARKGAGMNPDDAQVRDQSTVEGYLN